MYFTAVISRQRNEISQISPRAMARLSAFSTLRLAHLTRSEQVCWLGLFKTCEEGMMAGLPLVYSSFCGDVLDALRPSFSQPHGGDFFIQTSWWRVILNFHKLMPRWGSFSKRHDVLKR